MASIADRMSSMAQPKQRKGQSFSEMPEHGGEHEGGGHMQIHDHGDGTYHSVSKDGEKTEHPHVGHLAAHVAHHHEPEAAHSHVMHHEDGTHTSHHAKDGQVSGPHDHENLEGLKSHMDQFLNEESHEGGNYGHSGGGEHSPFGD